MIIRYVWRLYRHRVLSVTELSQQPDLTVSEVMRLTNVQRETARAIRETEG